MNDQFPDQVEFIDPKDALRMREEIEYLEQVVKGLYEEIKKLEKTIKELRSGASPNVKTTEYDYSYDKQAENLLKIIESQRLRQEKLLVAQKQLSYTAMAQNQSMKAKRK